MKDYRTIIDRYYPVGTTRRDIYMRHCRAVADEALAIVRRRGLPLDESAVEAAAMLHDIGIVGCHAPSIGCEGDQPYIRHGIIGGEMLRTEGYDEALARVAERHTGSGITIDDIRAQRLPLPEADYCPATLLERLICYADKFYSKSGDMKRIDIERVRQKMLALSEPTLARFDRLAEEFGD